MGDGKEVPNQRCGGKRKAPEQDTPGNNAGNVSKKPWGTNGPPPPEWIEVQSTDLNIPEL
jgi:hypothetical protein